MRNALATREGRLAPSSSSFSSRFACSPKCCLSFVITICHLLVDSWCPTRAAACREAACAAAAWTDIIGELYAGSSISPGGCVYVKFIFLGRIEGLVSPSGRERESEQDERAIYPISRRLHRAVLRRWPLPRSACRGDEQEDLRALPRRLEHEGRPLLFACRSSACACSASAVAGDGRRAQDPIRAARRQVFGYSRRFDSHRAVSQAVLQVPGRSSTSSRAPSWVARKWSDHTTRSQQLHRRAFSRSR
jgi:hypothetical protein